MNTLSAKSNPDDREEGEIVDDDVFEDISDNSISDIGEVIGGSGKSVSHKERLRTLSLSSISDAENRISSSVQHHHNWKSRHHRRSKSEKRNAYLRKRKSQDYSSDSDDNLRMKKRIKLQLKEAIRIDTSAPSVTLRNSLQARLQGMANLSDKNTLSVSESNSIIPLPSENNTHKIHSNTNKGEDFDQELQELRLEALKTAIVNKHKHRIKRNLKDSEDNAMSDSSQKSDLENNKENSAVANNVENTEVAKKSSKEPHLNDTCDPVSNFPKHELPSPIEEDADALRALLLASMNNKTKKEQDIDDQVDNNLIKNKVIEIKTKKSITSLQNNSENTELSIKVKNSCLNKNEIDTKIVTASKIIRKKENSTKLQQNSVASNNKTCFPHRSSRTLTNSKFIHNKMPMLPPVERFIIHVNAESDSEDDVFPEEIDVKKKETSISKVPEQSKSSKMYQAKLPTDIEVKVDHLLKQERAKVEASVTVATVTPQKQDSKPKSEILEKSVVKLLPEYKQIEYRKLISKIQSRTKKRTVQPIQLNSLEEIANSDTTNTKIEVSTVSSKTNSVSVKPTNQIAVEKVDMTVTISGKSTETETVGNIVPPNTKIFRKAKLLPTKSHTNKSIDSVEVKSSSIIPKATNNVIIEKKDMNSSKSFSKSLNLVNMNKHMKIVRNNGKTMILNKNSSKTPIKPANMKQVLVNEKPTSYIKKLDIEEFKRAVKDMQIENNGSVAKRLQIKGKYRAISGLMKKINEANAEKKRSELHVKKLLQELSEARKQVAQCHENYTCLVKELVNKKAYIDKSTKQDTVREKSTPTKELKPTNNLKLISSSNIRSVDSSKKVDSKTEIIENVENNYRPSELIKESTPDVVDKEGEVMQNGNMESKQVTKGEAEEDSIPQNEDTCSLVDKEPLVNEVEKKKAEAEKRMVRHYVSPLGNYLRCEAVNPLDILCPYEVSGSCRDPDCKFTHFSPTSAS